VTFALKFIDRKQLATNEAAVQRFVKLKEVAMSNERKSEPLYISRTLYIYLQIFPLLFHLLKGGIRLTRAGAISYCFNGTLRRSLGNEFKLTAN